MGEDFVVQTKEALIRWNNAYPLDRPFRKKYGIAYNSAEHRNVNQIDVFMEWVEDRLYNQLEKDIIHHDKEKKDLEKGKWLKDRGDKITPDEEIELFDKIQL